jgi:hypothetical protein
MAQGWSYLALHASLNVWTRRPGIMGHGPSSCAVDFYLPIIFTELASGQACNMFRENVELIKSLNG